jgi:hypothetical protein
MNDREFRIAVIQEGLNRARDFWMIPQEIATTFFTYQAPDMSETASATILTDFSYLTAGIYIPLERWTTPEKAWEDCGHEVAHLVSRELNESTLDFNDGDPRKGRHHRDLEKLTTRLGRVFAAACPYPGDAYFKCPPLVDTPEHFGDLPPAPATFGETRPLIVPDGEPETP